MEDKEYKPEYASPKEMTLQRLKELANGDGGYSVKEELQKRVDELRGLGISEEAIERMMVDPNYGRTRGAI